MLPFLQRLFGNPKTESDRDAFRDAISIDVSGPDFRDLYPTQADIAARLQSAGIFHDSAVPWMAQAAQASIAAGAGLRENVRIVVATGSLLAKDELKALGLHHGRKVGADFIAALHGVETGAAIDSSKRSCTRPPATRTICTTFEGFRKRASRIAACRARRTRGRRQSSRNSTAASSPLRKPAGLPLSIRWRFAAASSRLS